MSQNGIKSKSSKRRNNGQAPTEKVKQQVTKMSLLAGVPMVKFGTHNNFQEVKRLLGIALLKQYPAIGDFPQDGAYKAVPEMLLDVELPAAMPGNAAAMAAFSREVLTLRLKEREKDAMKRRTDLDSLYGAFLSIPTEEGLDAMKMRDDWPAAEAAKDPLMVWDLIVSTHGACTLTGRTVMDKQVAKQAYAAFKMTKNQSLITFNQDLKALLKQMVTVGCAAIPGNEEQAMDFLFKLDTVRYGDMLADLQNAYVRGLENPPVTIEAAYQLARSYVTVAVAKKESNIVPTSFNVDSDDRDNSNVTCYNCNKKGHYANKCPEKATTGNKNKPNGKKKNGNKAKPTSYANAVQGDESVTDKPAKKDVDKAKKQAKKAVAKAQKMAGEDDEIFANWMIGADLSDSNVSEVFQKGLKRSGEKPCILDIRHAYLRDISGPTKFAANAFYDNSDSDSDNESNSGDESNSGNESDSTEMPDMVESDSDSNSDSDDSVPDLCETDASDSDTEVDDSNGISNYLTGNELSESDSDSDGQMDAHTVPIVKKVPKFDKMDIIWDTAALLSVTNQLDLLSNVVELTDPQLVKPYNKVDQLEGDKGYVSCKLKGDMGQWGETYYDPDAPCTLLNTGYVEDTLPVQFVQGSQRVVSLGDGVTAVFVREKPKDYRHAEYYKYQGDMDHFLYVRPDPDQDMNDVASVAFQSEHAIDGYVFPAMSLDDIPAAMEHVRRNPLMYKDYTKKEIGRAIQARELLKKLGFVSYAEAKRVLNTGVMINCPLTSSDIDRAEEIYGPDVAQLKGKMTNQGPVSAKRPENVEVIRSDQVCHVDIAHLDRIPFMINIVKPLNLLMITQVPGVTKTTSAIDCIRTQVDVLRAQGFEVVSIEHDPDRILVSKDMKVYDIPMHPAGAGSHAPVAERGIRVIKERVRCILADLPYKLPRCLIKWAAYYAVSKINCVPRVPGVPSAREIFLGRKLDFSLDLPLCFGDVVQLFRTPKRSNDIKESRSIGCIALGPVDNLKGTWRFWNIATKSVVTGDKWTKIHVTQELVDHMAQLYAMDDVEVNPGRLGRRPHRHVPPSMKCNPTINDLEWDSETDSDYEPPDLVESSDEDDDDDSGYDTESDDESSVDTTSDSDPEPDMSVPQSEGDNTDMSVRPQTPQAAERQEVSSLADMEAVFPVFREKGMKVIPSQMLNDPKQDGYKARLVAGGHRQDETVFRDTQSPTCNIEIIFMVLAIAAAEKRHTAAIDIKTAYLNAVMKGEKIFMDLNPHLATLFCEIRPEWKKYVDTRGRMTVELLRALYGCKQSAKLWYDMLVAELMKLGFKENLKAPCCFNMTIMGSQATVCVHVDDLLITHDSHEGVMAVIDLIKTSFKDIVVQDKLDLIYLGMKIHRCENYDIEVSMEDYEKKIVEAWQTDGRAITPGQSNLFDVNKDSVPLDHEMSKEFHTGCAKLLYISKRTRPDILTPTSVLAGRVIQPTEDDRAKLNRVYQYLKTSPYGKLKFKGGKKLDLKIYADAAYMCHDDMKSRTGMVVLANDGVIATNSSKQKFVTKSSTEAEFVSLCDAGSMALYLRQFLELQGMEVPPIVLYQDNKSVMELLSANHHGVRGSKHIQVRYFFVRQHVATGELVVQWIPTAQMLADIMTKPLIGQLFKDMRDGIMVFWLCNE